MSYIQIDESTVTTNSFEYIIRDIRTDLGGKTITIFLNNNSQAYDSFYVIEGSSTSGGWRTITGLSPNIRYTLSGRITYDRGIVDEYPTSDSITTKSSGTGGGNTGGGNEGNNDIDYFYWDNEKWSGGPFNITAREWTRLQNTINKALKIFMPSSDPFPFTEAVKGEPFRNTVYNEVDIAIAILAQGLGLNYTSALKSSGMPIRADDINELQRTLNLIIDRL